MRFNSNANCMTGCEPYSDYHFCYLGWGSSNWVKCTPDDDPHELIYYSSKVGTMCTSKCGAFGYNYQWCFTGAGGQWEYCSFTPQKTRYLDKCVKPIEETGGYYWCLNNNEKKDQTSPPPINLTALNEVSRDIQRIHCIKCKEGTCKNRQKRQGEGYILGVGVLALAATYRRYYNEHIVNNQGAVRSYITMRVPPIQGLNDIDVPVFVHARVEARHLVDRTNIPSAVTRRMIDMNAVRDQPDLPNDERGHLVAASLGGPNDVWNFVPQTPGANRRYGFYSHWYTFEGEIRDYIRRTGGYVDLNILIAYGNVVSNRRPARFGVNIVFYEPNGNVHHDTGDCVFTNNPQGPGPDDINDLGFQKLK